MPPLREEVEVLPWQRKGMGTCVSPGMSRCEEGARADARRAAWAVRAHLSFLKGLQIFRGT